LLGVLNLMAVVDDLQHQYPDPNTMPGHVLSYLAHMHEYLSGESDSDPPPAPRRRRAR
jgi:VanZ family protein